MEKNILVQEWLVLVGQENLQSFQDAFAIAHGLSMCFLGIDGEPITSWSNVSLPCQNIMRLNKQRCQTEFKNALLTMQRRSDSHICKCYMGLNFCLCPVWYNNQLVATVYIGGLICDATGVSEDILKNFHISLLTYSHLNNIVELLQKVLALVNVSTNSLDTNYVISSQQTESKEFSFLNKRVTKRETEVAKLICQGLSNRQIAEELFISEKTVKTHVSNLLVKVGLKDRMQLIVEYCRLTN